MSWIASSLWDLLAGRKTPPRPPPVSAIEKRGERRKKAHAHSKADAGAV